MRHYSKTYARHDAFTLNMPVRPQEEEQGRSRHRSEVTEGKGNVDCGSSPV